MCSEMSADLQDCPRLLIPILEPCLPCAQADAAENSRPKETLQKLRGYRMAVGLLSLNEALEAERERLIGSLSSSKREHKLLLPIFFTCLKYCT
jgi:hypothetical protein